MELHRSGTRAAQAVVLIHGIPGAAASWTGVARHLATDCDVVVPDLLGFGRSPGSQDLLAHAQASALLSALREAGIDRATIVGHDFGGPIALEILRRAPDKVTGVALIAANLFPDTPVPFPLSTVRAPIIGDRMARMLFSRPALRAMVRVCGGTHLGDASSVRTIFTRSLQHLAELYAEYPSTLRSIEVPAAVLWGTRDPFFPVSQARRTAALVTGAELVLLEGAGHFLPEQRPDEVADAIRALIQRSGESSGDALTASPS